MRLIVLRVRAGSIRRYRIDRNFMEHPIQVHVRRRIRARRNELDLSIYEVAERMGTKANQISTYECTDGVIGAAYLYLFAKALEVPVSYFFEGLPETTPMKGIQQIMRSRS
jgi:transcriptional regulator with XRE-family HTH domain